MFTFLFAGDLIPPEKSKNIYSEELRKVLHDKDFSIVNLETPLTTSNEKINKTGNNFRRHPESVKHIKDGYWDAVALSNNHIRDYGDDGVLDTIDTCKQSEILTVGAGKNLEEASMPLRINLKGKKISILNYSEREFNIADNNTAGANPYDSVNAFYDIQKEKQENDYVIVIYHGGIEYQYYPTPEMVRKFKFMVDVGADAIVSHHTHRYSGSMVYKGKPMLFGLGNFISHTNEKVTTEWQIGIIARLTFDDDKVYHSLIPTIMNTEFNHVELYEESESVLRHVEDLTEKIENIKFYSKYWIEHDIQSKSGLIRLIKSTSRTNYRLRKYFSIIFNNQLGIYKTKILVNLMQCDSHRERIIRLFKSNF